MYAAERRDEEHGGPWSDWNVYVSVNTIFRHVSMTDIPMTTQNQQQQKQ